MRSVFIALIFITWASAHATQLPLTVWDQEKLAELVLKLPSTVKEESVSALENIVAGSKVKSVFPKEDLGLRISCESDFYGDSPFPSKSFCTLDVDEHHPNFENAYDEFLLRLEEVDSAKALYATISYGTPLKRFRSSRKAWGTAHTGKKTYIFDYYFTCSESSCLLRFSNRNL